MAVNYDLPDTISTSFDQAGITPISFGQQQQAAPQQGGNPFGILGTLAGIAISIAVPFVAPAIASAVFGSSVMAAWGGFGGVLASAGVGAALGGLGAAVTGNSPVIGALTGGLGGGIGQAAGGLFGAGNALGAGSVPTANALAPAAGLASAPGVAAVGGAAAPATVAGAAGGLGASSAPAAGLSGFGAFWEGMPWDKLGNAALSAAPSMLGAAVAEFTPPDPSTLAIEGMAAENLHNQQQLYKAAATQYNNIDPNYFAQTAANSARLRTAQAAQEGTRSALVGLNDPARLAAENRRNSVAASSSAGQAYNDAYLTALEAKRGQLTAVAGLRPNYSDYAGVLSQYGTEAEKKRRAEEIAGWLSPFASAFAKSNTGAQAGTA